MTVRSTNWSLDPTEWDTLSELLSERELSWSRVVFHRHAAAAVPEMPGVYAVCARSARNLGSDAPDLLNMLYVGISDSSVRDRFTYHLNTRAKAPMKAALRVFAGGLDFYYSLTSQPGDLEEPIYRCFGPVINAISPPGLKGRLGNKRVL